MTAERFWYWVGGRRFLLTVGSGLVNSFLRWHDKIDQMVFRDLIIATVGSYLTATAVQKWKEAKSASSN